MITIIINILNKLPNINKDWIIDYIINKYFIIYMYPKHYLD